jgi:excisionase family DNA binding protein
MTNDNNTIRRLYLPRDAAKYLAISERTLWNLTHTQKIPAVHIGRRGIRYDIGDLDAFINKAKGGSNVG